MENLQDIWLDVFPKRVGEAHKYDYGHAVIYGAPELTGATRLAAEACSRMGAGLTTVLSTANVAGIYRCTLPAHIIVRDNLQWTDTRVTAKLYGSGGLSVAPDFGSDVMNVLDAEALYELPEFLSANFVLTPHEGEFARVFPNLLGSRTERALAASRQCGAVVVLKGAKTLVAHPDGRIVVNGHAAPYLATAGSGDVLAGMICGLLAQGMPVFEAACAAVWIHGECALRFGRGLVASDLSEIIPQVLQDLT